MSYYQPNPEFYPTDKEILHYMDTNPNNFKAVSSTLFKLLGALSGALSGSIIIKVITLIVQR